MYQGHDPLKLWLTCIGHWLKRLHRNSTIITIIIAFLKLSPSDTNGDDQRQAHFLAWSVISSQVWRTKFLDEIFFNDNVMTLTQMRSNCWNRGFLVPFQMINCRNLPAHPPLISIVPWQERIEIFQTNQQSLSHALTRTFADASLLILKMLITTWCIFRIQHRVLMRNPKSS